MPDVDGNIDTDSIVIKCVDVLVSDITRGEVVEVGQEEMEAGGFSGMDIERKVVTLTGAIRECRLNQK